MKKFFNIILILISFGLVFTACEDRTDLTPPSAPNPNMGNVDFTRFVSIGNSLTAGYQSGALYQSSQMYSFGKLIADQVGTNYVQPLLSDPGLGGRIEVVSVDPFEVKVNTTLGTPLNPSYQAPYNNLGVPGAILYDILDTTDFSQKSIARENPFFLLVLRNSAFGKSIFEQAKALNPTFLTIDIGNNDVLGYATSGGTSGTDQTGKNPTEASVFNFLYNQLAQAIATELPNTKVAFSNIPDVTTIPFFTTVGPGIAQNLSSLNIPAIYYQRHGEYSGTVLPVSSLSNGSVLVTLLGQTYAGLIGTPTGKFYKDNNADISQLIAGGILDTTKLFGLDSQNPWPDALTLDSLEIATVNSATNSYNTTISNIVASNPNFVLVDIKSLLNNIRSDDTNGGTWIDGLRFSTAFVQGGLFGFGG